jgi:cell wall-associated NlpC family hydrolase
VARPSPAAPAANPPARAHNADARGEAIFQALLALGVDYRYGGASHETGFDCSGLVAHVYREAFGIRLPRDTKGQSTAGRSIELRELQPGDLVFYNTLGQRYSHVGIYIGDGRFVHAPKSGARVRTENINARYWTQRFNGARRIET